MAAAQAAQFPPASLKGWKAIAGYFGRDERTVMRWAEERGLPVRRLPGEKRSPVYALQSELDEWLAGDGQAEPAPETAAPPARPLRLVAILLVALVATGLFVWLGRSISRPAEAPHVQQIRDPAAERAFLQGSYDLQQRTPASLRRALTEFGAAITADPSAAAAYAGLGETYLLLREYSAFGDAAAYARAGAAARAAIAIDPKLPAAHRVLGFVAFWGQDDIPTARREFRRALALAPADPLTRHWYATALAGNGQFAEAAAQIEQARRLDTQSTALLADTGILIYLAGRQAEGLEILHRLDSENPEQLSAHTYLASIALQRGDARTYLAEAGEAARLRADPAAQAAVRAARDAFAHGAKPALLATLFKAQQAEVDRTGTGLYELARIAALMGDDTRTLALLHRAIAAHEPAVAALPGELWFSPLKDNPGFRRLAHRTEL